MKDKEKIKPTKKRVLLYYLVLAACILVIAAITIAVVFAVRGGETNLLGESNADITDPSDEQTGGEKDPEGSGGSADTSSKYEFIVPIREVNPTKAHVFGYDKTMDWYRLHEGMDFTAKAGTEVLAAVDGTVKSVTSDDVLYGTEVTIEHANGVTTVYRFIDASETLKEGSKVNRGDVIGTVAVAEGVENLDGDHLHFEVFRNGEVVDPDEYLNILSK